MKTAAIFLVLALVLRAADATKPSLKLVSSTVQAVPSAPGAGVADLFVEADGFTAPDLTQTPLVRDLDTPPTPGVAVTGIAPVKLISATPTSGVWQFSLAVSGLPRQSSLSRKLLLSLSKIQTVVDYTLTDRPTGTFAWTILPPPVWNLIDSSAAEISVVVKDVQATGIKLLQSTLTRQSDPRTTLGIGSLDLCTNRDGECQAPGPIGPSASQTLFLRLKSAGNGSYTGNVVIRCDQKPEGETIPLTLNVTSGRAQAGGIGAILVSLLFYTLVVFVARYNLAKNARIELALLLQNEVTEMEKAAQSRLATAPAWLRPKVSQAFDDLFDALTKSKLRPYLPSLTNTGAKADEFKTYLQGTGNRLASLHVVVGSGLSKIEQAWNVAGTDAAKQKAVQQAADDLLEIPDEKISTADTKIKVDQVLNTMNNKINAAVGAGAAASDVGVQLQHVWLSNAAWTYIILAVWFVVTLLVGAMIMVFARPGFGSPSDYGLCLLWGFGLPAAGTQLNQLSSGSVGPRLGLTLPKADS